MTAAASGWAESGRAVPEPAVGGEGRMMHQSEMPSDVPFASFTARDWAIFRTGQQWGHDARQSELDAALNAYRAADDDADRYYRAAFDHEYHDCSVHTYTGKGYAGARTRLADDDRNVTDAVYDAELENARRLQVR